MTIKHIQELNIGDTIKGRRIKEIDKFPNYIGVWFTDGQYERYTPDSTINQQNK